MNRPYLKLSIVLAMTFCLTSCAMWSRHHFVEPETTWQSRSGQLLYRGAKTTLIGEVLVRYSKNGDFELTFSKGPGVTLLFVRQDATFGRARGPLARGTWSGPVKQAPPRLRGWFSLREKLMQGGDRQTVRQVAGKETFLFHF